MIIKVFESGPLMVNCYIVGDEETGQAAVVDPGGNVDQILKILEENKLKCTMIVNTHTHFDHVGGNAELKRATGAELVTHPDEAPALEATDSAARLFGLSEEKSPPADRLVREGDILRIGKLNARIVELRGHSPCGIALIVDDEKIAIVGDALFAGSIGRTDFPGGSFESLISDIREKLFVLPDETVVLTGHGPPTEIGREKGTNPFF